MAKIVQCMPNFSEGHDLQIIETISLAIQATKNVSLLDVKPGGAKKLTVYTFAGLPPDVVNAALAAARAAYRVIDMTKQKGEHIRIGTLDACPFIPVKGLDEGECVQYAKDFGRRLAEELTVPVYLFGLAAEKGAHRATLQQIKAGGYEGLASKLLKEEWAPDFGPSEFVSRWGVTATGTRKVRVEFKIKLYGSAELANSIATKISDEGRLEAVQGFGWKPDHSPIAEISLLLTDLDVTPIHVVYEEVRKEAGKLQAFITSSEIAGFIPLKILLNAANYYAKRKRKVLLEENIKVAFAQKKLGLHNFNPQQSVIEYRLGLTNVGPLAKLSVEEFVLSVGARTAAPGDVSVASLLTALGGALATMVGQVTYGKRGIEAIDSTVGEVIPISYRGMVEAIPMVDQDPDSFNDYMAAMRLPISDPQRSEAIEAGLRKAIQAPLKLARFIDTIWDAIINLASVGDINYKSDLQMGARCLKTAMQGARDSVLMYLGDIKEDDFTIKTREELERLMETTKGKCRQVFMALDARKKKSPSEGCFVFS